VHLKHKKSFEKDHAIGVIVYHDFHGLFKYLILKHRKGHWSFAKGHRDPGETVLMTAIRELHEEAGIDDVEFLKEEVMLKEKYQFINGKGVHVKKDVWYFIARSNTEDIVVDNKEIMAYKWCTLFESERKLTFKQSYKILREADALIRKHNLKSVT
jgi:8-oxo-dGTP pyrophosphatase MutT (NUDIX family)